MRLVPAPTWTADGEAGAPSTRLDRRRISEVRKLPMPNALPIAAEENQKEVET
jgi:hypothetical protein